MQNDVNVWLDATDAVAYQLFAANNLLEFYGQRSSAQIWIAHEHERTILRKILAVCANRLAEISPLPEPLAADVARAVDTACEAVTGARGERVCKCGASEG